mmetsp:Transcript_28732/g.96813  ORF Transcript_28732/g.96813 Transcript_28732/m.96813 type:complete len:224 (+) Transcript_28732:197-868(+)
MPPSIRLCSHASTQALASSGEASSSAVSASTCDGRTKRPWCAAVSKYRLCATTPSCAPSRGASSSTPIQKPAEKCVWPRNLTVASFDLWTKTRAPTSKSGGASSAGAGGGAVASLAASARSGAGDFLRRADFCGDARCRFVSVGSVGGGRGGASWISAICSRSHRAARGSTASAMASPRSGQCWAKTTNASRATARAFSDESSRSFSMAVCSGCKRSAWWRLR